LSSEIERLEVCGLRIDEEMVDLRLQRVGDRVAVSPTSVTPESVHDIVRMRRTARA
jgi:hypothetical protein